MLMAGASDKTKAFDYAQEATKQVLTLATAVVTITVSFLKDIVSAAPGDARTLLYIAWGLFTLSILGGIATLYNLTGHVGEAETSSEGINVFGIRLFSGLQLISFVLAIACVVYFGARAFT
ncbi:MAG TPA: hypothetical protein VIH47_06415 [Solirubrobacterales bacterium]